MDTGSLILEGFEVHLPFREGKMKDEALRWSFVFENEKLEVCVLSAEEMCGFERAEEVRV